MNAALKYDILLENVRKDPFDLGNTFKGLSHLNNQRNVQNYAEELVEQYAKLNSDEFELSLYNLPDYEQNELARLLIEQNGREITECVNGNDFSIDNEYTCALLSMLKNDTKETRESFAEVTRKNIVIYFADSLQEILNDACEHHFNNLMNEQGYYSHRDMEHGDVVWGKF